MQRLSISPRFWRLLAAVAVALGVLGATLPDRATATSLSSRTPVVAATDPHTPARTATVRATPPLTQATVLTSTSGLTVVWLPSQVATGGRLNVVIRTIPGAAVTLKLGFPDGTAVTAHRRAAANGYAQVQTPIVYEPQGSAEDVTVTVTAVQPGTGLNDSVSGNVAVLQHIALTASLRAPKVAMVGRQIAVTVVANEPGALVRFRLTYPDGAVESLRGGYTDASGLFTRKVAVARSDGTRGYLIIQAIVTYDGVQVSRTGRVALRARKG